jgi:YesN/AraC family two-component response regulator
MKGSISVTSEVGCGSTFKIILPITTNAPFKEFAEFSEINIPLIPCSTINKSHRFDTYRIHTNNGKPLVLIVEDSYDLIDYLSALLCNKYQIGIAQNGKYGFNQALEIVPDVIVSDVMMPEMDGIQMLDLLKNDLRTSHIAIILLTAKADITSRLIGLERGADAYIAKPFNDNELLIRIDKLIELRKRLQERYSTFGQLPSTSVKVVQIEDTFITKVRNFMEENIKNECFEIKELCALTAMSRAQLYKKFKSLTNRTISEYLRTLRLYKAKELLESTELNVTEVCFEVGFNNLSHFSRIFTEEFGVNPSEIRK